MEHFQPIGRIYRGMNHLFSRKIIAGILGVFLAVIIVHTTTFADQITSDTSSNWSGYIGQSGAYTGVSGTWTVPALTYSTTMTSNATWVGIGGKVTSDLIQAGVYEIANSDGSSYQAWYEMLPNDSTPVNLTVHPGDSISVAILETSQNVWNIVLTNNTSKQQFEKTVTYTSSLSTAEWIQERPLINGTLSTLSGFTPITFTGATAVQNGVRVPLAQTNPQTINLIDTFANTALSVPSPINTNGTSFSVFRTSATMSAQPTVSVDPTIQSIIPPYELHRTGHDITIGYQTGITWVNYF
jgi:hypothetical protein